MTGNGITDDSAIVLATAVAQLPMLEWISLAGEPLADMPSDMGFQILIDQGEGGGGEQIIR